MENVTRCVCLSRSTVMHCCCQKCKNFHSLQGLQDYHMHPANVHCMLASSCVCHFSPYAFKGCKSDVTHCLISILINIVLLLLVQDQQQQNSAALVLVVLHTLLPRQKKTRHCQHDKGLSKESETFYCKVLPSGDSKNSLVKGSAETAHIHLDALLMVDIMISRRMALANTHQNGAILQVSVTEEHDFGELLEISCPLVGTVVQYL